VIRTLIVDDEPLAREVLREYLRAHPDIEVIGECANGFEAVRQTVEAKPDLLLLDIQMPRLNGFEVLELLAEHPAVIFVTAYDEFALRAFEVHAVDYLLKPFDRQRLEAALARVRERLQRRRLPSLAPVLAGARSSGIPLRRLLIRDRAEVRVVPAEEIDYLEAQDDYVSVRTAGRTFLKQARLTDLEKQLDPSKFVRVHRSFIVNVERLKRIELYAKDSRVLFLRDGTKIPVSRSGYARLKNLL
jgi:two-component system, LytTR family, response regulator